MAKQKKKHQRRQSAGQKQQINRNNTFHSNLKDVYAVCLIALSVLLIVFTFTQATGVIGKSTDLFMKLIVGVGRYILPFMLLAWAIHFLLSKEEEYDTFGYGLLLGFIGLITIYHLQLPLNKMVNQAIVPSYGGILGGLFAYAFKYLFGAIGGYIAAFFCLVIGLMLVTEIKLSSVWGAIKNLYYQVSELIIPSTDDETEPLSAKKNLKEKLLSNDTGEKISKKKAFTEPEIIESLTIKSETKTIEIPQEKGEYILPSMDIFKIAEKRKGTSKEDLKENIDLLNKTLHNFDVDANVSRVVSGPTVARYEVELASGVKVNRILSLADDISLTFASPDIRIIAPIPGKSAIGIEVPNGHRELVTIGEILTSKQASEDNHPLTVGLGKDISGSPVLANLGKMPHLLIAGATGSGKSICINSIITSLLSRVSPDQVKMIMIDPKRVELNLFNGISHLLTPVVVNSKQAANALAWAVSEMENRYDILSEHKVKNIDGFNKKMIKGGGDTMPYIVLVIDELADLMMVSPREVEDAICRLAQLARAVGIHLVIATQRPSTDVITGLIKANITTRIAFAVGSMTDSRVILDTGGAEKLVGKGDALYMTPETIKPVRIQGCFITEKEIDDLVVHVKSQGEPNYVDDITKPAKSSSYDGDFDDDLFDEAMDMVIDTGKASVSYLQRRLRIGYGRAARLMDMLEDKGVVSAQDGSRPREVLVARSEMQPTMPEQHETVESEIEMID